MAGWTTLKELYRNELIERREEGVDLTAFERSHPGVPDDTAVLNSWYDALMSLPIDPKFPYDEPSAYADILAARPAPVEVEQKEIPFDRFYGAWLGRCIGCALGKPLETEWAFGWKKGFAGWKLVYEWFRGSDSYPVRNYVTRESRAAAEYGIRVNEMHSLRENIQYMESDDDIRYTVLGHKLLREKGFGFTTWDVGQTWLTELPYHMVCTAEKQAYLNLPYAQELLDNGSSMEQALDYTRTFRNPYREWIGAQIRVDGFAYAAAGRPELAADFACRDASLSHVKNGVYGEMLFGAMIAAAFVEHDPHRLIEIGLSQIPKNCRLAHDVRDAMAIADSETDPVRLVERIWNRFCAYNGVHTNNNAALCVAAILFGNGDFEKAVTTAVLGGWDTDCNGATVGSLMGAMVGAENIPAYWKDPLHDTLNSNIFGYHPISIAECARQSMELNQRLK